MRLSRFGRTLYAVIALANLALAARCALTGDWIGGALFGGMAAIFGVPAARGRDSFVDPRVVSPRVSRWLHRPGTAGDGRST